MTLKKLSLIYLATYLLSGGLGFVFFPEWTLKFFQSNEIYGHVMTRSTGMFMVALGGLVATLVYYNEYRFYAYSIFIRTFMTLFVIWLYTQTKNPMFLILIVIVLIGLLPAYFVYLKEKFGSSN